MALTKPAVNPGFASQLSSLFQTPSLPLLQIILSDEQHNNQEEKIEETAHLRTNYCVLYLLITYMPLRIASNPTPEFPERLYIPDNLYIQDDNIS